MTRAAEGSARIGAAIRSELSASSALAWAQVFVIALVAGMLMLMMGGVQPGPKALAGAAVAGILFVSGVWRFGRGVPLDGWERAWLWVWLVASGWIALQLLPLPREVFAWIGAYPRALLERFPELPITRLSPNSAATVGYWGMFTTYWAASYLVAGLPRRQLGVLVALLVALVFAEALYGFVAHANRYETVLGLWPAPDRHGVVVGTFWNRNHLAGLLALCWPLGIAYLLFGVSSRPVRIHEFHYFLVFVFCIVVALALFNTLSRLGTVAGLFGLIVFAIMARANRAGRVSGLERLWLTLAGLVALGLAVTFGLLPLLLRYAQTFGDTGRLEVLGVLTDLPAKTWLAGAGAGAFADVFKLVQPASLVGSYYYLHNDWAQLVLELGVIGTALLVAASVFWWRRVGPPRINRLRAGAAGGIAAIALHSLGDFNLQIPGTAFAFWITVGVLCNRALAAEAGRRRSSARAGRSSAGVDVISASSPEAQDARPD